MGKTCDIPVFGTLAGVKVLFSAVSIAGPFAASMFADHGADVTWIEHPVNFAIDRTGTDDLKKEPYWLEQDRRNMRSIKLDVKAPEGKEIFCKMIADTDIFLEASKGGGFSKMVSDEEIWAINPKCTIIHLNGFGLTGMSEYVNRACYDTVAQAYGGAIWANATGEKKPSGLMPYVGDYYSGWACVTAGLMGYIKALKTGHGDSVDVSQVDIMIRCGGDKTGNAWNYPAGHKREFFPGDFNSSTAGFNSYLCKDGKYILLLIIGAPVVEKMLNILGVEAGSDEWPIRPVYKTFEDCGVRLDEKLTEFCMQYTADELEELLSKQGIPAACIMSYKDMLVHPYYQARESLLKVKAEAWGDQDIYVSNVVPRFKLNPGMGWKEAPYGGEDTAVILEELGYSEEQIAELAEKKVALGRSSFIN